MQSNGFVDLNFQIVTILAFPESRHLIAMVLMGLIPSAWSFSMTSSTARVAKLRRKRRAQGLGQFSIWLTPEDQELISAVMEREGLKSQSEAIRLALNRASDALLGQPTGELEHEPIAIDGSRPRARAHQLPRLR